LRVHQCHVGIGDDQPVVVAVHNPAVEHCRHSPGVGSPHAHAPGRSAQHRQVVLQDEPAPVDHADPGAELLDLGQLVAGQEDGGAGRIQLR
jgi:hypothetical protein